MKSHTIHRTFHTEQRREFIRITDDVQAAVGSNSVTTLSSYSWWKWVGWVAVGAWIGA